MPITVGDFLRVNGPHFGVTYHEPLTTLKDLQDYVLNCNHTVKASKRSSTWQFFKSTSIYSSLENLPRHFDLERPFLQIREVPPPTEGIILKVKTLTGKFFDVKTTLDIPVQEFKEMIAEQIGSPSWQIRIIYSGHDLEDGHLLSTYGLKEGSTVYAILRLRGGMYHFTSGRDGGFARMGMYPTRVLETFSTTDMRIEDETGKTVTLTLDRFDEGIFEMLDKEFK